MAEHHPAGLRLRFRELMKEQPQIIDILIWLALKKKADGWDQYSIYGLMNDLRGLGIHVDNNFGPDLGRVLAQREPKLEGFFRNRRSKRQREFEDRDSDWGDPEGFAAEQVA
jgi:hypothetical protein